MKTLHQLLYIVFFASFGLLLTACEPEEMPITHDAIVGKWKVTRDDSYTLYLPPFYRSENKYCPYSITFNADSTMLVDYCSIEGEYIEPLYTQWWAVNNSGLFFSGAYREIVSFTGKTMQLEWYQKLQGEIFGNHYYMELSRMD